MGRWLATFFSLWVLLFAAAGSPAVAAKRVALVIGNSAYVHATPLRNPKNDAEAISAMLRGLGFEVVTGFNLSHRGFAKTIGTFSNKLGDADVALFFYGGHGLQVNGRNFLAPVDARLDDEASLDFEAVRLSTILTIMERKPRTNLVFLDACRDNPLARNLARGMGTRSAAIGRGLARVETGVGTMIAFATQPGNVALDGGGDNSPFAKALITHIATPGLDIAELMRRVRLDVIQETKKKQVPWNHSSLTAPFRFKERVGAGVSDGTATGDGKQSNQKWAVELAYWNSIKDATVVSAFEAYLKQYPEGTFAALAKIRIDTLNQPQKSVATTRELSPVPAPVEKGRDKDIELTFWKTIQDSDSKAAYESYLKKYPKGSFASLARLKIEELGKPKPKAAPTPPPAKAAPKPAPRPTRQTRTGSGRDHCTAMFVLCKKKCIPGANDGCGSACKDRLRRCR